MDTPICDFVRRYAESGTLRLHMPGHKGIGPLGFEQLDITEIQGADSLYEADGIIAQSEANASEIFGCPTFYSTEGSSQCIRAMIYLAMLDAHAKGKPCRIAAGRNVHKTFLSAVALLDVDVVWIYPKDGESYLSCPITQEDILSLEDVTAVYLTSPDYLGNMADIAAIREICRKKDILLLVDNAHGAYLRFLQPSLHPMDLGADICCDSAHKTLPVLTGGAYLHIRDPKMAAQAKDALALFGSTSPSYLILQSLDAANAMLADPAYSRNLAKLSRLTDYVRQALCDHGLDANQGNEPLKLTIFSRHYGYTGAELAEILRENGIECEFSDPDFLVLMLTPAIKEAELQQLIAVLTSLPRRLEKWGMPPQLGRAERVLSVQQAMFAPSETIAVEESLGRILASPSVGCPPAVPILVCGERIDENAIACFQYYGIKICRVCK